MTLSCDTIFLLMIVCSTKYRYTPLKDIIEHYPKRVKSEGFGRTDIRGYVNVWWFMGCAKRGGYPIGVRSGYPIGVPRGACVTTWREI